MGSDPGVFCSPASKACPGAGRKRGRTGRTPFRARKEKPREAARSGRRRDRRDVEAELAGEGERGGGAAAPRLDVGEREAVAPVQEQQPNEFLVFKPGALH